jgi:hypothetical protein
MIRFAFAIACGLILLPAQAGAQQPARVTILYDAFGPASALQKDWGFAALIQYADVGSSSILATMRRSSRATSSNSAYLKRGVSTAQRWSRTEGLPVHRLPHAKAGTVFACRSEIDVDLGTAIHTEVRGNSDAATGDCWRRRRTALAASRRELNREGAKERGDHA